VIPPAAAGRAAQRLASAVTVMLERIRASLSQLAPAEQRVARLVLKDPRRFAEASAAELASQAHVSKPTVVRFCRSMGYEGLTDFKLKLMGAVSEGVPYVHQSVGPNDNVEQIAVKVVDNAIASLLGYRNSLSAVNINRAVDALERTWRQGGRIEFHGVGNSGIVAQDAQHKFFRLGVATAAYSDGHLQIMSAALLKADDVLVIISNSGRTRDLLDACDVARRHGARTIAITRSASPLAAMADIHLAADHSERYDRDIPMVSRLLNLVIVDILATALAVRIGVENVAPRLKEIKSLLSNKRYA
jgi:RpiR family carbohydrate utilization transcriptional regulator